MSSRVAVALVMVASLAGCGRTAPWLLGDGDATDTGETSEDTEETGSTETETDSDTDETETGGGFLPDADMGVDPEPKSCRDMLMCVFECVANLDPQCFAECGQGADPQELQAAVGLMGCLIGTCTEAGACSLVDLQAEECIGCIGLGLFLPQPPGCEAEAEACE